MGSAYKKVLKPGVLKRIALAAMTTQEGDLDLGGYVGGMVTSFTPQARKHTPTKTPIIPVASSQALRAHLEPFQLLMIELIRKYDLPLPPD